VDAGLEAVRSAMGAGEAIVMAFLSERQSEHACLMSVDVLHFVFLVN